ncbi:MAG: hypothetical protein U0984_08450 [Prosthecobacter sp.]|nr:hypothetical protein [Prosthecobacter sp.]
MNSPNPPSALTASANLLPKLAALAFLVIWSTGSSELPLTRLGLIFGSLALFEALTAAALKKQDPILKWGDLPLVAQCLFAPTALPLYALLAAGVVFLGGEAGHGKRLLTAPPTERSSIPPRYSPSTRGMTTPPGLGNQPGPTSGPRPMSQGMPAPSAPGPSRPPFGTAPRPSISTPTASSRPASPTAIPSAPVVSPTPPAPPSPTPQPTTAPKP